MESIVRDIIIDKFLSSDLFSDNQYGFIKGRSTVIQLLKIMDEWTYNLDQGIQIDVIYTDFQKAFDKVPHQGRLIESPTNHNMPTCDEPMGLRWENRRWENRRIPPQPHRLIAGRHVIYRWKALAKCYKNIYLSTPLLLAN